MRRNILTLCRIIIISLTVLPQPVRAQNSAEPFLSKLNTIRSAKDTATCNRALQWLDSSRDTISLLYNPAVDKELQRLKAILDEYTYDNLVLQLFDYNISINTDTAKYASIRFAKEFVEAHNQPGSETENHLLLAILDYARVPFRNSNRIFDGIRYYNALIAPAKGKNDSARLTIIYYVLGGFYFRLGLREKAEYATLKSIDYLDNNQPNVKWNKWNGASFGLPGKVNRYAILGANYINAANYEQGKRYLTLAVKYYQMADSPLLILDGPFVFLHLAIAWWHLHPDSSAFYFQEAYHNMQRSGADSIDFAFFYQEKAADFIARGQLDSAVSAIVRSKSIKESSHLETVSYYGELVPGYYRAKVYLLNNNPFPIPGLLQPEINELKTTNARVRLQKELQLLADAYGRLGKYQQESSVLRNLLDVRQRISAESDSARAVNYEIEKQIEASNVKIAVIEAQAQNDKKANYYLLGIAGLLALCAVTLVLAFLNKRKSNQKLGARNDELNQTLAKLKSTQSQLIQSEKMASLGELTAGIAHEIQNPLNFVNNFSDVNKELLQELKEEADKGNIQEVKAIADDVITNQEKINHHGKRADAIVKGMLQHSRQSSGQKELTDISALADEYLRLSYHGLRAKDKNFNAEIKTDLDESIGKINIIPQDIGRVLLNLFNNAFYACTERSRSAVNEQKTLNPVSYNPTVSVKTEKCDDKIQITVKDNGKGIPQKIIDKIFQPFFTTKPTGEGTGLGLSLSYDIVKAHGGEIKVESKEGEGSEFVIQLRV